MTWQFNPAPVHTLDDVCAEIIALSGDSGSGKTYSALLLAQSLARGGKVYVLDTEAGRARRYKYTDKYPELHPYDVNSEPLGAPFSSENFEQTIAAADDAGYKVIIVDSASDEWDSEGGVLDHQDSEMDRMAGNDWKKRERVKMAAWIKPKMAHKHLINSLTKRKAHIILCFRSQRAFEMVEKNGKQTPVEVGFSPIMSKDMRYKFDFHLEMDPEKPGHYQVKKCFEKDKHIFPAGGRIDSDCGKRLLEARTGQPDASCKSPPDGENTTSVDDGAVTGERQAPALWTHDEGGGYQYPGEPDSDAFRILYKLLIGHIGGEDDADVVRVYEANQELISLMPEAGRRNLESLYKKRVEQI